MRSIVFMAMVLGFVQAHAYLTLQNATMRLDTPVTLNLSTAVQVPAGEYSGVLLKYIAVGGIFGFGSRDGVELKMDINGQSIDTKMKFEKNSSVAVENQSFSLMEANVDNTKIVSGPITEERDCVVSSFTTQENCHVVTSYHCLGTQQTSGCGGQMVSSPEVLCDNVENYIHGRNTVVYQKTEETFQQKILITDKASSAKIGEIFLAPHVTSGENQISATRCQ